MRIPWAFGAALWIGASWCAAASLDFAVSVNILSANNRFGVDSRGNILIAASPSDCTLPTVHPLYPCGPIWIGKLDPSAQKLLFATYLGGVNTAAFTTVAGIGSDPDGNLIVAAHSVAQDLPTVNPIQAEAPTAFTSLYVAKLAADGSRLLYATYLGGTGGQTALSLAVDGAGAAYVAGNTTSVDFPSTSSSVREPAFSSTVIAKLGPDGSLQYADTFPFDFFTDVKPIQVDAAGSALLSSNVQVLRVSPDGSSLTRTPLPDWARQSGVCAADGGGSFVCPGSPWVLPGSGGGLHFAGTAAGGLPVTGDAAQNFRDANSYARIDADGVHPQLTKAVSGLAVDPQNRSRIYAATSGGLLRSDDNGVTWNLLRDGKALAVAVDPFDSNRLYLSVDANPPMYRSTDGGASWIAVGAGIAGGTRISSIAADFHVRGLLYAAGGLLFRSTDGGDTWDSRSVGPSHQDISPSASTSTSSILVRADPTHAYRAYVMGINRCIGFCPMIQILSRTQDGGGVWTDVQSPFSPYILAVGSAVLDVDPASGDVVEAVNGPSAANTGLLAYRGGDFGAFDVLYPRETTALAFDPEDPGTIYLAIHIDRGEGSGYFVVQSVDSGASWTKVAQVDRPVLSLAVGANGVLHATLTPDFPEAYVAVTDASGGVRYGTYLGAAFTQISAAAVSKGMIFVAGESQGGLPVANAFQPAPGGGTDAFVAVFDESGTFEWSTYLGGSGTDLIDWVLPLPDGSVVVVGATDSKDFPSLQPSPLGAGSTFIARLRP